MSEDEKYKVPESTKGDVAHAIAKGAAGVVPYAGGFLAELLQMVIVPPLEKRKAEWMNGVADGLRELERKTAGFSVENLKDNEQFISAVLNTSQVAIKNHQKEKLEALRNAVLNVAVGSGLTEDQEAMFLGLVDRYTPWHLCILRLFQSPLELAAQKGIRPESFYLGSRTQLVETYFPELKGQNQLYNAVVAELAADRMLGVRDLGGMITAQGMFQKVTTEWGDRFLAFITSPV
jgi:hypothetical protein